MSNDWADERVQHIAPGHDSGCTSKDCNCSKGAIRLAIAAALREERARAEVRLLEAVAKEAEWTDTRKWPRMGEALAALAAHDKKHGR